MAESRAQGGTGPDPISNRTKWSVSAAPVPQSDGTTRLLIAIKSGHAIDDAGVTPLDETPEVVPADEWADEPGCSHLSGAAELGPPAPGRQFYLQGSMPVPDGGRSPAEAAMTITSAGGERLAERRIAATPPARWRAVMGMRRVEYDEWDGQALPLDWSLAYGGICPRTGLYHPENPAGVGFRRRGRPQDGEPLPRFHPANAIWKRAWAKSEPSGLGPLPVREPQDPRRTPREQRLPGEWEPGDQVTMRGLAGTTPDTVVDFRLPPFRPVVQLVHGRHFRRVEGRCDTLVVDTTVPACYLLWRSEIVYRPGGDSPALVVDQASE